MFVCDVGLCDFGGVRYLYLLFVLCVFCYANEVDTYAELVIHRQVLRK
jgi:hypothetical protein